MTKTVTFQTILVPARETDKAFCILGGEYRPKSLCTVEYVGEEYIHSWEINKSPLMVRTANITMPEWLAKK